MSFHVNEITFGYPNAPAGELALCAVSATLPAGEVIAILGPSGCGKTTLLHLLSLLLEQELEPDTIVYHDGQRKVDYHALHGDPHGRAVMRRTCFGVVLQSCYLLPHFSCLQNICLPLALLGWSQAEQHAWAEMLIRAVVRREQVAAQKSDLWEARVKMPRAVSLGQKQRMAVLRAIAHNPRVVFADEPISNLDRTSTQAVLQLLLDWRNGKLLHRCTQETAHDAPTRSPPGLRERLERWQAGSGLRTLILVCHHPDIAKDCADRVLLFDEGHRLVGTYTPRVDARGAKHWPGLDATLDEVLKIAPLEK